MRLVVVLLVGVREREGFDVRLAGSEGFTFGEKE